ncbi:MAG TPA: hypothetical protein G4N97_11335 [Thermoflexia bacterium]|nr:hypothetical protein [Thermoflexia bacterium]
MDIRRMLAEKAERRALLAEEIEHIVAQLREHGLPGGIPSRFYTDPEEASVASALARRVIEAVARRLEEQEQA